jgi:hypothetical protein
MRVGRREQETTALSHIINDPIVSLSVSVLDIATGRAELGSSRTVPVIVT